MDPPDERLATPVMPSFASLRGPVRRSPVDVLVPVKPPDAPPARTPRPVRPPEWTDLLHLVGHVARWSLRQPVRCARRLLGA